MKCLWLERGRVVLRKDVPPPVPAVGEVAVRVLRAGICGTDIALIDGMYDFTGIPGHEFVGVAIDGPRRLRERRVVGEINVACGTCPACKRGERKHCSQRKAPGIRSHHGAFAEYLVLPVENVHCVPDSVTDDAAAFTEPLAAALDILDQINIRADQRVLVVGDGKLAQLVCRVLALTGATVDVVGHYSEKLQRLNSIVAETYRKKGFESGIYDIAIECTGDPSGVSNALNALRPKGTLIIKSTVRARAEVDMSRIVVDELRLIGSRCGPFDKALALLEEDLVNPLPLIDARFAIDDAEEAIIHSRKPGVLKVLLDIG